MLRSTATAVSAASRLGDLVTASPDLARVLERHGLDYCCGGGRTLGDACAERDLDVEAVVADLAARMPTDAPPPAWAGLPPGALTDHLEAVHHRPLDDELPRLSALLEKIEGVHGGRHPELVEVRRVYEQVRTDLEPHLRKEEQVLFPMVRELDAASGPVAFHCGTLRNPISVMLSEHDRVGELLDVLRALTDDFTVPADGCASYEAAYRGLAWLDADTRLHVHKENNVLFPAVVALEDERSAR